MLVPLQPLSRQGLNPVKLARLTSAGLPAQLTVSAFNRLGQYASRPDPGRWTYFYAELPLPPQRWSRPPPVGLLISLSREGMARLSWPGGYIKYQDGTNATRTCERVGSWYLTQKITTSYV